MWQIPHFIPIYKVCIYTMLYISNYFDQVKLIKLYK